MSDARRPQTRAVLAFVAVVASLGAAFGACTSYQRSDGDGCIKDVDCISGHCIAQQCGTPPPILNGSSYEEAGSSGADAGVETSTPGTDSSPAAPDSSGGDSAADGPAADKDVASDTATGLDDSASGTDADNSDATGDASEMDASDSSDEGPGLDANPDGGDAQDAFNQMSRRAFFV